MTPVKIPGIAVGITIVKRGPWSVVERAFRHDADGFEPFIAVQGFLKRMTLELHMIEPGHRLGSLLEFGEMKESKELVVCITHPPKAAVSISQKGSTPRKALYQFFISCQRAVCKTTSGICSSGRSRVACTNVSRGTECVMAMAPLPMSG